MPNDIFNLLGKLKCKYPLDVDLTDLEIKLKSINDTELSELKIRQLIDDKIAEHNRCRHNYYYPYYYPITWIQSDSPDMTITCNGSSSSDSSNTYVFNGK